MELTDLLATFQQDVEPAGQFDFFAIFRRGMVRVGESGEMVREDAHDRLSRNVDGIRGQDNFPPAFRATQRQQLDLISLFGMCARLA